MGSPARGGGPAKRRGTGETQQAGFLAVQGEIAHELHRTQVELLENELVAEPSKIIQVMVFLRPGITLNLGPR